MRHGSLESGQGGFDLAADWIGWDNIFHCEINPFCRMILNYYWPKAKSYADVFGFNGYEWRGRVDIITGGFPCQPFSRAGKRKGSSDDRHLWPQNMRIVREAQPPWCVFENVPGIISIENGMVFEQVCLDLENEGYEVAPFIIPACATDKDHRRDRVWFVAYNNRYADRQERNSDRACKARQADVYANTERWALQGLQRNGCGSVLSGTHTNTNDAELQRSEETGNISSSRTQRNKQSRGYNEKREHWLEAAPRLCSLDDGLSRGLDTTAISKSKWRTESLKAAGNAIVPQIAFEIFKAIEQFENTLFQSGK